MRGLNETRALKFNHPGLETTATRSGGRLLISKRYRDHRRARDSHCGQEQFRDGDPYGRASGAREIFYRLA